MDDITIRTATLADVDTVTTHNLAMAAETEGLQLDRSVVRSGVRRVVIDEQHGIYYLAQRSGQIIAQLLVTREWNDWRDDWFWWIQHVYVVPAARGAGVYRTLHHYVEQKARRAPGVCGIRLYVDRRNTVAHQVYQQLGLHATNYDFMELAWKGLPQRKTEAPGSSRPGHAP